MKPFIDFMVDVPFEYADTAGFRKRRRRATYRFILSLGQSIGAFAVVRV
jgi:hypothetical protein